MYFFTFQTGLMYWPFMQVILSPHNIYIHSHAINTAWFSFIFLILWLLMLNNLYFLTVSEFCSDASLSEDSIYGLFSIPVGHVLMFLTTEWGWDSSGGLSLGHGPQKTASTSQYRRGEIEIQWRTWTTLCLCGWTVLSHNGTVLRLCL